MFMQIVFIFLMVLLIVSSGAAIHLGVFKANRQDAGFVRKGLGGFCSYGLSTLIWLTMYSHHYMGW